MTCNRNIILAFVACLGAAAASAQTFDIDWFTIDGGGGMDSTGGGFTLSGTIGQPDAGEMTGGGFRLVGGFWGGATIQAVRRGDMNCDGRFDNFDIDPFVLALIDPSGFAAAYPGCNIANGDINQDGRFDNFDIDPFVLCIVNLACP